MNGKKNLNIDTIFLLVETNKDVASKYLRQITPNIIQDFGFLDVKYLPLNLN